jgi:hypothetical protein
LGTGGDDGYFLDVDGHERIDDASAGKGAADEAREDREEWRVQYTRHIDAHCSVSSERWPLQAGAFEKHYRVGRILGKGSFSTVFKAWLRIPPLAADIGPATYCLRRTSKELAAQQGALCK